MSMASPLQILLVEDNPGDAILLREMLRDVTSADQFALTTVVRLGDALQRVLTEHFDVMLLDLSLPDARGLETLARARAEAPGIPIVVLTGLDDHELALRAVQDGAQDYLVKGHADGELLVRAIRYAIERQRMVVALEQARQHEHHLASHDALTGLPNRQLFYDRLGQALAQARRHEQFVGVLFMDLDHFKLVNDSLGHHAGDELLRQVGRRLESCVRESDTAARLGGDEFTAILYGLTNPQDASVVAQNLLERMAEVFPVHGHEVHISCSIGISVFPEDGEDVESVMRNADMAMYRAKGLGRNTYRFFTAAMNEKAVERMELDRRFHAALEGDLITVDFQPQVDVRTGVITSFEAIPRWDDPELGRVPAERFIALAEEAGLMPVLGERILRAACSQGREWREAGFGPVRVAVNVSSRQLQRRPNRRTHEDATAMVSRVLELTGLAPDGLELEISEAAIMSDPGYAVDVLRGLHETGLHLVIDDWGEGHCSLSQLRNLPVVKLKIHHSFIERIVEEPASASITGAIIQMAHSLGMKALAQGVETPAQWERLRFLRCDEAQGDLFGSPLSASQARMLLLKHARGKSA